MCNPLISMIWRCSIRENIKFFQKSIRCPSDNDYKFCQECLFHYFENLINENNISGIIMCPCGCEQNIIENKQIEKNKPLKSKQIMLKQKHMEFIKSKPNKITLSNIQNIQDIQHYINEEILTTKCPKCKIAYSDFDGCCVLNCNNCKTKFCAYCRHISLFTFENHRHIRHCKFTQNKGAYFAKNDKTINDKYMLVQFNKLINKYPRYYIEITKMMPKTVQKLKKTH